MAKKKPSKKCNGFQNMRHNNRAYNCQCTLKTTRKKSGNYCRTSLQMFDGKCVRGVWGASRVASQESSFDRNQFNRVVKCFELMAPGIYSLWASSKRCRKHDGQTFEIGARGKRIHPVFTVRYMFNVATGGGDKRLVDYFKLMSDPASPFFFASFSTACTQLLARTTASPCNRKVHFRFRSIRNMATNKIQHFFLFSGNIESRRKFREQWLFCLLFAAALCLCVSRYALISVIFASLARLCRTTNFCSNVLFSAAHIECGWASACTSRLCHKHSTLRNSPDSVSNAEWQSALQIASRTIMKRTSKQRTSVKVIFPFGNWTHTERP